MHDNRAAQNALGSDQLDMLVRDGALAVALAIGLEIAEVAYVAVGVFGGAVLLAVWVDFEEGLLLVDRLQEWLGR